MMQVPKKYFHDRLILFLLSINAFFTLLTSILILLRLDSNSTDSYLVQYRSNLGIGGYQYQSNGATFFTIILFAVIIFVINTILSMRIYDEKRDFSVVILSLGTLLVVLTLIVSNAMLVL